MSGGCCSASVVVLLGSFILPAVMRNREKLKEGKELKRAEKSPSISLFLHELSVVNSWGFLGGDL